MARRKLGASGRSLFVKVCPSRDLFPTASRSPHSSTMAKKKNKQVGPISPVDVCFMLIN